MAAAEKVLAEEIEQAPEPSLREQIESARDEVIDRQQESGLVDAPKEGERTRDASGRFTRSEKNETTATQSEEADRSSGKGSQGSGSQSGALSAVHAGDHQNNAPTSDTGRSGSVGSQAPASALDPAPQGWTPGAKAQWNSLPDWARAEISRRETETHRAITAQDEVRRVGNDFMRIATQHAPLIQARGGNPVALFNEFLGILNTLHSSDPTQRAAVFRDLAARNGADLRALLPQPQTGEQPTASPQSAQAQQPIHPAIAQMSQEWNAFKRQQQEYQQRQQEETRQREEAERQQTTAEIMEFRSKPGHEHFDTVKGLMTSLLLSESASSLEEAYQLAVKAHPETSKVLEQQAQAAAEAEAAKRAKTEAAKRKAGSLRPGVGNVPEVTGSKGSIRDDLRAAFDQARGRV